MFKSILAAITLTATTVLPSMASLTRIGVDRYSAVDANNQTHYITYVRQDHEGDVQVRVDVGRTTQYYWVNCRTDRISAGGDNFNGWAYVDHRKMEGYYSDVACRM